eukprot:PhM_4_TR14083/c0_g1_i1/m.107003
MSFYAPDSEYEHNHRPLDNDLRRALALAGQQVAVCRATLSNVSDTIAKHNDVLTSTRSMLDNANVVLRKPAIPTTRKYYHDDDDDARQTRRHIIPRTFSNNNNNNTANDKVISQSDSGRRSPLSIGRSASILSSRTIWDDDDDRRKTVVPRSRGPTAVYDVVSCEEFMRGSPSLVSPPGGAMSARSFHLRTHPHLSQRYRRDEGPLRFVFEAFQLCLLGTTADGPSAEEEDLFTIPPLRERVCVQTHKRIWYSDHRGGDGSEDYGDGDDDHSLVVGGVWDLTARETKDVFMGIRDATLLPSDARTHRLSDAVFPPLHPRHRYAVDTSTSAFTQNMTTLFKRLGSRPTAPPYVPLHDNDDDCEGTEAALELSIMGRSLTGGAVCGVRDAPPSLLLCHVGLERLMEALEAVVSNPHFADRVIYSRLVGSGGGGGEVEDALMRELHDTVLFREKWKLQNSEGTVLHVAPIFTNAQLFVMRRWFRDKKEKNIKERAQTNSPILTSSEFRNCLASDPLVPIVFFDEVVAIAARM